MEYINDFPNNDISPKKPINDWATDATRAWLFGIVWTAVLCPAIILSGMFHSSIQQMAHKGSITDAFMGFVGFTLIGTLISIPYVVILGDWEKWKPNVRPRFLWRSLFTAAIWFAVPALGCGWHGMYGPEWHGLNVRVTIAIYVSALVSAWVVGRALPRIQENRVQPVYNKWDIWVWLTALLSLCFAPFLLIFSAA